MFVCTTWIDCLNEIGDYLSGLPTNGDYIQFVEDSKKC